MTDPIDRALSFGVRDDGTVDDCVVETLYLPCVGIASKSDYGVLRVFMDGGGTDFETRVLFSTLVRAGWTPPAAQPKPVPALGSNSDQTSAADGLRWPHDSEGTPT